jgi:exopolysaccharide biosynthesis polyprenyl glycosylphosphotransferase
MTMLQQQLLPVTDEVVQTEERSTISLSGHGHKIIHNEDSFATPQTNGSGLERERVVEVVLARETPALVPAPTPTIATLAFSKRVYRASKRALDIVLALAAITVSAPIMLTIAILIKLDSRGPVLFRQIRVGRDGKPFEFYKFRSMYHNADPEIHKRYVQSFIHNQVANGSIDAPGAPAPFKLAKDPRITPIGAFLRRSSLDELPQFFNVLRGDMSFVGPRPPLPYEVAEYQDWHRERLATTPGLTGWWQVYGRSKVSFDEMVRMDIQYIARQSLWLDLKLLVLTIPVVLLGKGAR